MGCSSKNLVKVQSEKSIQLDKNKKSVFLTLENLTEENLTLEYTIKKALEEKGYTVSPIKEHIHYHLLINIISARELTQKSVTNEVLSNVNFNIGLGGKVGSVGVSTRVGTQIGKLFAKGVNKIYQVIVDVSVDTYKDGEANLSQDMQLIVEGDLDHENKAYIISLVEEAITKKIVEIF